MILLDTDVMVDILRGYEPAKEWLKTAQETCPGLRRETSQADGIKLEQDCF
jgi:predicted nucleic acid-binding protein